MISFSFFFPVNQVSELSLILHNTWNRMEQHQWRELKYWRSNHLLYLIKRNLIDIPSLSLFKFLIM